MQIHVGRAVDLDYIRTVLDKIFTRGRFFPLVLFTTSYENQNSGDQKFKLDFLTNENTFRLADFLFNGKVWLHAWMVTQSEIDSFKIECPGHIFIPDQETCFPTICLAKKCSVINHP